MAFSKTIQMFIFDGNPNGRIIVKRPAKRENFLCQGMQYFQGFQPLLTKELNCEK